MRPPVLLVAGLDPSGGAGLLADAEALAAVGARAWALASALTAQGPGGARGFSPTTPDVILEQLEALLGGGEVPRAVKTGMLGTAALAKALSERLTSPKLARAPLVMDPVLSASSGAALFDAGDRTVGEALAPLLERARLATPNLSELARLTGRDT